MCSQNAANPWLVQGGKAKKLGFNVHFTNLELKIVIFHRDAAIALITSSTLYQANEFISNITIPFIT